MADKPEKVMMVHEKTGRTMEASQAAFDREYSGKGWKLAADEAEETAPAEPKAKASAK